MALEESYVRMPLEKTERALGSINVLDGGKKVFDMASRYVSDAGHSLNKGDLVTAFAQIEYAHGLLDGGVGSGVCKANSNFELFFFADSENKE